MNIAIIGAGASGLVAALQAAWGGAQVTLYESNPGMGRKLLVTGSGRCNITNASVDSGKYGCGDPAWIKELLNEFGLADWLSMLKKIGIPVYKTWDGWYYPASESAQSVVNILSAAVISSGVNVKLSTRVTTIQPTDLGFKLAWKTDAADGVDTYTKVIVAAGGTAYPTLGSRGELFPELQQLGHTIIPKRPALAPVLAELGDFIQLQGLRFDAGVTLIRDKQEVGHAAGNMIFTQWGLNGPPVMDLSYLIQPDETDLQLRMDFLYYHHEEFSEMLSRKSILGALVINLLEGFFPPKAAQVFLKSAGISAQQTLAAITDKEKTRLMNILRVSEVLVKGVRGFEYCQVSAGGIPVSEVSPRSMESLIVPGLYLTGETLDVVGPCGGYNLQYAFSSGAIAGKAVCAKT